MSLVTYPRRPSLDDVALALSNYRAQKVRQGALVSLFPAIQRRCTTAGGELSFLDRTLIGSS
jgi:hypothetical protein